MAITKAKMTTNAAELRIKQTLRSKPPPATHCYLQPGDPVQVNKAKKKKWCGPVTNTRLKYKKPIVTDDNTLQNFGIRQTIPYQAHSSDRELTLLLADLNETTQSFIPRVFIMKTLHHPDFHFLSENFFLAMAKKN